MASSAFIAPYSILLRRLCAAVVGVEMIAGATPLPQATARRLVVPLQDDGGRALGAVLLELAPGTDPATCLQQVGPGIACLAQALAARDAARRSHDARLLHLAHDLDLDFPDDACLDKALAAVARRTGVELAWLAAPRCLVTLAARGHDQELDDGVAHELVGLRERVTAVAGRLKRPLIINGPAGRAEHSAACRLLLVPLFLGRSRHNAWLVLANPLAAAPFAGGQVLAAMTLGQVLARRLEVDLDRRTGLFNRGGLAAALARLGNRHGSMMLLDIDRLQSVNHVHGMAAGDAAIMALARLLAPPLLPPGALVARIHGDQFAVALPGMEAAEATTLARRVQDAAALIQPGQPDDMSPMTLSGGVIGIDDFRNPFERFALDADTALKLAKDRGRSRIEQFSSSSSTLIRRNDEIIAAADLREALRSGAVLLFAQPIRLLADRSAPPSFELLIRVRDEAGEIRPPGDFISAAQNFQLLPGLDRYVVDAAMDALSPHRGLLMRLSSGFSINISGHSLTDQDFVERFIRKLRESRVPPALITVEVTEQAAVTNMERAATMMRRLRHVGCGIAIDDFGTGANSLAYLRSLPVTRIKIDGSFVRDMLRNRRSEAGVKGMMELARAYRLDTVAEYVESEPVAARLQALGVARGQGYLFGKPAPVELALQQLEDEERAGWREVLPGA